MAAEALGTSPFRSLTDLEPGVFESGVPSLRSVHSFGCIGAQGATIHFRDHLRTTAAALKNWALAQIQDSLAVGVLWLAGLSVLHVPWAPLWALIAAVLQIVPHLGPILGLLGPVLAATVKWKDWEHALGVLILYAIIVVIDGLLLQPYIMRRTAKVPIWASILGPIVLGILWPFWGVLLAAPLLAVLYAFKARYEKNP